MAGRAHFYVQGLPGRSGKRHDVFAFRRRAHLLAPLRIHGPDRHDDTLKVTENVVPLPLAGRIIAEYDFVAVLAQATHSLAELAVDRPNIRQLSGQKRPARSSVKSLGIRF